MVPPEVRPQVRHYLHNVLWSWLGVLFGLVSGLLLSPFVIHHLGDARYGIWLLVFSLVDYYALVDIGFRSAVVKFSAHYRATGELDRLEELVSTGLVYFTIAAVAIAAVAFLVARNVTRLFHVPPSDFSAFRFLTVTVALGFSLGVVFNTCTAVLEGCQRFDITSRILIVNNGVRVVGCFAAIWLGLGLKAMGIAVLAGQCIGYLLTWRALRRILPGRSLAPRKASLASLRRMLGYGVHTFVANMSLIVLNQDAPVLIGHFLSSTLVGYFGFPLRLLNFSADLVGRMGMVTGSRAAELTARGDLPAIARMAVVVNRYCLMLFLPLAAYLAIFGRQLLGVWLNPAFAAHSAPLLPVLGVGVVIGVAAQYNSTSILYGLARHAGQARILFAEAALSVAGLWYVIPRYGILRAACLSAGLMILSRGLAIPYLVSRELKLNYATYLGSIYARPLSIAVPVSAAAWMMNEALGAPATWRMVLGGGAIMAAVHYAVVFAVGLEAEHRRMALSWIAGLGIPGDAPLERVG